MRDYKFLEKPLFTLDEAREEFSSKGALYGALRRAIERGDIMKLTAGLYCSLNTYTRLPEVDRFEIATALRPEGCCAYHTALEYHGLARQKYDEVQIASERQEGTVIIDGLGYRTYRSRCSGGVVEMKGNAPVRVTDLERTMLDCLDRLETAGGLQEVFRALCNVRSASEEKLLEYLESYNTRFLYKKAGYILSVINPPYISAEFINLCRERSSARSDDIRPTKGIPFIFSTEWNLYVPSYIAKKRTGSKSRARADEPAPLAAELPADMQEPAAGETEGTEAPAEGAATEGGSAADTTEDTG